MTDMRPVRRKGNRKYMKRFREGMNAIQNSKILKHGDFGCCFRRLNVQPWRPNSSGWMNIRHSPFLRRS